MPSIRWGIVGCGDVTEVKSGPGFLKAEGSQLVAVMRRDADKARDYAARHGVPKWTADAAELIHDPEVDAVYVATPPNAHKDAVLMCAAAGKPVLVEKPLAHTLTDARAIVAACEEAHVPLFSAYYRRALPQFVEIKRLIDSGAIGTPRAVAITHFERPRRPGPDDEGLAWRGDPAIGGGGIFVDIGCHALDFLDHLFGPIVDAVGFAARQGDLYPAEDNVTAAFTFESGVHGNGRWCFTAYDAGDSHMTIERTHVMGTGGEIEFSCFHPAPVVLKTPAGTREFAIPNPPHVHQPLIQTVVDDLLGRGTCPSTGESGLRATVAIDRILASYRAREAAIGD